MNDCRILPVTISVYENGFGRMWSDLICLVAIPGS